MLMEKIKSNRSLKIESHVIVKCDKCLNIRKLRPSRFLDKSFALCNTCFKAPRHLCDTSCSNIVRICTNCFKEKTLINFGVKLHGLLKHTSICKICVAIKNKNYKQKITLTHGNGHVCSQECTEKTHFCRQCEMHRPLKHFGVYNANINGHFKHCLFCSYKDNVNRNKSRIKRNITFELNQKQYFDLIDAKCCLCGEFSKNRLVSGIDRKDNALPYSKENSVSMCEIHNFMKGKMNLQEIINQSYIITSHLNVIT